MCSIFWPLAFFLLIRDTLIYLSALYLLKMEVTSLPCCFFSNPSTSKTIILLFEQKDWVKNGANWQAIHTATSNSNNHGNNNNAQQRRQNKNFFHGVQTREKRTFSKSASVFCTVFLGCWFAHRVEMKWIKKLWWHLVPVYFCVILGLLTFTFFDG